MFHPPEISFELPGSSLSIYWEWQVLRYRGEIFCSSCITRAAMRSVVAAQHRKHIHQFKRIIYEAKALLYVKSGTASLPERPCLLPTAKSSLSSIPWKGLGFNSICDFRRKTKAHEYCSQTGDDLNDSVREAHGSI